MPSPRPSGCHIRESTDNSSNNKHEKQTLNLHTIGISIPCRCELSSRRYATRHPAQNAVWNLRSRCQPNPRRSGAPPSISQSRIVERRPHSRDEASMRYRLVCDRAILNCGGTPRPPVLSGTLCGVLCDVLALRDLASAEIDITNCCKFGCCFLFYCWTGQCCPSCGPIDSSCNHRLLGSYLCRVA